MTASIAGITQADFDNPDSLYNRALGTLAQVPLYRSLHAPYGFNLLEGVLDIAQQDATVRAAFGPAQMQMLGAYLGRSLPQYHKDGWELAERMVVELGRLPASSSFRDGFRNGLVIGVQEEAKWEEGVTSVSTLRGVYEMGASQAFAACLITPEFTAQLYKVASDELRLAQHVLVATLPEHRAQLPQRPELVLLPFAREWQNWEWPKNEVRAVAAFNTHSGSLDIITPDVASSFNNWLRYSATYAPEATAATYAAFRALKDEVSMQPSVVKDIYAKAVGAMDQHDARRNPAVIVAP